MNIPEQPGGERFSCVERDGVAVLTLQRGAFDITLNPRARDDFFALLSEVERTKSVKALLVVHPSSYPDVERQREFLETLTRGADRSPEARERLLTLEEHTVYRILERLIGYQKLVVAAMQGDIASPFFGLSLAFPIRLAADDAVLRFPQADFGFPPCWPLCLYLPRYVGQGRAAEILLSGKPLDARALAELGLVQQLFPSDRFEDLCIAHTTGLCRLPGSQISGINLMLSPDPSEISNSFAKSMTLMKSALHSAPGAERDGMAPAHCR